MLVTTLCWALVTALPATCVSGLIVDRQMSTPAQCPGKVLAAAYRYRTVRARSAVECVSQCRAYDNCLSALFDADNSLCHLGNATSNESCSNMEAAVGKMKYYETNFVLTCENGGVINPDGKSCTCPEGLFGDACSEEYLDCKTYVDQGVIPLGSIQVIKTIKPRLSPEPFDVKCDYLSAGITRTRVILRNDEAADVNLTFVEYRDGFGNLDSDTYFVGLERLYQLTNSKPYELRFKVKLSNAPSLYQGYSHFAVDDEASGYAFNYSYPTPRFSLGDCLVELRGAKFSAYDVDNDGSASVNCARLHGGGWWFKGDNCSTCNPFGPIIPPFDGERKGVPGEAFWTNDMGDTIPFVFSATLVDLP